tara:strand:- start:8864 stop:9118 length:255 start_codon:yes stop_codon:yes gene_type:complete
MKAKKKIPADNKGLAKLPKDVRNKMGYMKEGGKLKISKKSVSIDPPKGYHWMEEQGRYYLMEGEYKPHPGAVAKAKFKLASHSK